MATAVPGTDDGEEVDVVPLWNSSESKRINQITDDIRTRVLFSAVFDEPIYVPKRGAVHRLSRTLRKKV
jgi:hypothetical protein